MPAQIWRIMPTTSPRWQRSPSSPTKGGRTGATSNSRQAGSRRSTPLMLALDRNVALIIWQKRLLIASPRPVLPYLLAVVEEEPGLGTLGPLGELIVRIGLCSTCSRRPRPLKARRDDRQPRYAVTA